MDRRRLWVGAENAVHRADADMRHASRHPFDAAAQATDRAAASAAASAAEVLGAVSWLVKRKRGGPVEGVVRQVGVPLLDGDLILVPRERGKHRRHHLLELGLLRGFRPRLVSALLP